MRSPTLREVCQFLLGEAPLDGVWFGESTTGRAPFWWRHHLREALAKELAPPSLPRCTEVQERVATHYGIPLYAMWSPDKRKEWAQPRQVAMCICSDNGVPHTAIGRAFRKQAASVRQALRARDVGRVVVPRELVDQHSLFRGVAHD